MNNFMYVVLCDDHPVFREGLQIVLQQFFPDARLKGLSSLAECSALFDQENAAFPDLVLLDLSLGDGDARSLLPMLCKKRSINVVIVSASEELGIVDKVLAEGARGFISKSASPTEIKEALEVVLSGKIYVPPQRTNVLVEKKQNFFLGVLTPRQHEIAELISKGLTNREICRVLKISENTVKAHLRAVFRTLDVTNRTEAAIVWVREVG